MYVLMRQVGGCGRDVLKLAVPTEAHLGFRCCRSTFENLQVQ